MSYYIDVKYLNLVGHRLLRFTKKKTDLWNCRCPICGDSSTNKKKSRGYFYRSKNDLFFKCHNCAASQHFGTFLKNLDGSLYQQYVFERYSKGEGGAKAHTSAENLFVFEQPIFVKDPLAEVATRLDRLPVDNEAVQYCLAREIPREHFAKLWYIASTKDIAKIAPNYDTLTTPEPRLLIPFYNEEGVLVGVTLRALRGESLRYIMIKIVDNTPLIFGLDDVDPELPILVVEGALDSLFLDNAIACNGASFGKIETLDLPKEQLTIVFDNEPRNKEIVRLVERYIQMGYRVCIWPNDLKEKDINEMIVAGHDVQAIIKENAYKDLMAELKLTDWRNC